MEQEFNCWKEGMQSRERRERNNAYMLFRFFTACKGEFKDQKQDKQGR